MYTLSDLSYKPCTIYIVLKECVLIQQDVLVQLGNYNVPSMKHNIIRYNLFLQFYTIIRRSIIYLAYHIFD